MSGVPECGGDAGDVVLDFGFGGYEFDVEGDDLLFEEEQMGDEEEGGVGWGRGFCEESAGLRKGHCCTVDDAMSKVVEYRGLF